MSHRDIFSRKCPGCDGAGSLEIMHGPGACADSHDVTCSHCAGAGSLHPWDEGYAEAPRWRLPYTDPLVAMASNRAHYLMQRRMPWGALNHPYVAHRFDAMFPVVSKLRRSDTNRAMDRMAAMTQALATDLLRLVLSSGGGMSLDQTDIFGGASLGLREIPPRVISPLNQELP